MTIKDKPFIIKPAPARKYPHHASMNPINENNLIFLTVCTKNRVPWLESEIAHQILRDLWSDGSHWIVGPYILMPDHTHLIVAPASSQTSSFVHWIAWWKRMSSRRFDDPRIGWQKGFWDTRLRNDRHMVEKIDYMRRNPVRSGLVDEISEWRFQGIIHTI
jgi:REP element-mobilizing transposase RayT